MSDAVAADPLSLPDKSHIDAADHVLRYLRATYDQAIVYTRSEELANVLWDGWIRTGQQTSIVGARIRDAC